MTDDRTLITNDDDKSWTTDGASRNVLKMEKYLVPLSGRKDDVPSVTSDNKVTTVKTRVYDDKYYKQRSGVEAYMEGGEYEEFESVLHHCREDLKEIKKDMKNALENTIAYGKQDKKFKRRVEKYEIADGLRAALQHVDVALSLTRTAANNAEHVYNDVIHDAMDLMDSRSNENDPEDAIFEVL